MNDQISIMDLMPDPENRDFPDEPALGELVRHGKLGRVIDHIMLPGYVGRKVLLIDKEAGIDRFRCYRIKSLDLVNKHYVACLEREDGLFVVWSEGPHGSNLHECKSALRSRERIKRYEMG